MLPRNFCSLEAMRLLLRSFFGPFRRPDNSFTCINIYPFLPIVSHSTGFCFPIVHLSRKPHPSQMRLARLIVCLKNGKLLEGRLGRVLSHSSQPSRKFQHVTCVLGGLAWASAELIGNAKQATSEGKSGPVETELIGLAATALLHIMTPK